MISIPTHIYSFLDKIELLNFNSRINRIKHVYAFIVSVSFGFLSLLLLMTPSQQYENAFSNFLSLLFLTIIPGVILCIAFINLLLIKVRRLHDFDLRGPWLLLGFIPAIGGLLMLATFFIPGSIGPNRFGPQPPKASDGYILAAILLLVGTVASTFILDTDYISANWKPYTSEQMSIEFPHAFKVSQEKESGLIIDNIESEEPIDDYFFSATIVHFDTASPEIIEKFSQSLGLEESLKMSPEEFAKQVMISSALKESFSDIKIISDLQLHDHAFPGRAVKAMITDNNEKIGSSARVYLDLPHKTYYKLNAFYKRNANDKEEPKLVKRFFQSFQLAGK